MSGLSLCSCLSLGADRGAQAHPLHWTPVQSVVIGRQLNPAPWGVMQLPPWITSHQVKIRTKTQRWSLFFRESQVPSLWAWSGLSHRQSPWCSFSGAQRVGPLISTSCRPLSYSAPLFMFHLAPVQVFQAGWGGATWLQSSSLAPSSPVWGVYSPSHLCIKVSLINY